MIVPISSAQSPFAQTPDQPSESNMLMALALMKKQGRFDSQPDASTPSRTSKKLRPE